MFTKDNHYADNDDFYADSDDDCADNDELATATRQLQKNLVV